MPASRKADEAGVGRIFNMLFFSFLAVKIKIDDSHHVVSTYLLSVMKASDIAWLRQKPHTLPPTLYNHLTWIMGFNPGDRVVEDDHGEAAWRSPRRVRNQS